MKSNKFFQKAMVLAAPIVALPVYLWNEIENSKQEKKEVYHKNVLVSAAVMLPHSKKIGKGGEDAYVISPDKTMVAMADGVGGWNKKGVDPALFSNELCSNFLKNYCNLRQIGPKLKLESLDQRPQTPSQIDLKDLLILSVKETKSIGTSTFVAAKLRENEAVLDGLNLGDSGYMLVRAKEVVFKTKEQQYKFNHPFQCGTNYKLPYHAAQLQHKVECGDFLVMGTDGVFDNLDNSMILQCFDTNSVEQISKCIANKA
jgi:protein phosphatase PTC7